MSDNGRTPLGTLHIIERVSPSVPTLPHLEHEIAKALDSLGLAPERLRGRRIAIAVGSRGIASLPQLVRAICDWLKNQGSSPFICPAMGSHGGATDEGQRRILEEYSITPGKVGAEVKSSMATVRLGEAPGGFQAYMDRNAWEADGVVVLNRVKPHTDFSGKIESGLLKMIAVGLGKEDGARETHRWGWKLGFEHVIRAMSALALGTGKILCGVAVMENEFHEVCAVRAARAEYIAQTDEEALRIARPLVPRIPFPKLHLLVIDELGKNISGTGMDTKVIGRGPGLHAGDGPQTAMLYVRDLTAESGGNAVGMGLADVIHDRFFQKIDFRKTYLNSSVALNPGPSKMPMHLPSDREALRLVLGHLGWPDADEQRVVWIRNTLSLNRMAVSPSLAREAAKLAGWRVSPVTTVPQFDAEGNIQSVFSNE